jgi:UDP-N-acetylglucosamine transferase subunit ALG13
VTGNGGPPLVLVLVGTDHHPFQRLVDWADAWFAAQPAGSVRCLVQYGTARSPTAAEGRAMLGHDDVERLLSAAAVAVAHGGPSTISEIRHHGLLPVVLPRSPVFGEHVDDHQQRFARALAGRGWIRLVRDEPSLRDAVDHSLAHPVHVDPEDIENTATASALRLGALVENLVAHRRG